MMINHQHHPQRQPVSNGLLNYATYAVPKASIHESSRSQSMFSAYPAVMPMHMYAHSDYAAATLACQQRQQQPQQQQQQQQQHPTSASVISSPSTSFFNQSFRRVDQHHPLINQHHRASRQRGSQLQHNQYTNNNMAYTATPMTEEDLAEMQKLSEGWEPEVKGPLVGQRQSSQSIADEFATADPIYQQKTQALAKTFSHYRSVRGDGRCGWRAVGYAFFEKLLFAGDASKVVEQEARIRSLSNVINAAGYSQIVYEDFADELFAFMRQLSDAVRNGNAESILLEAFNNDELQSAIITHLRILTASWMKTHVEEYVHYTPELSVSRYCDDSIMPYQSEIDHVGLSALYDVLLAPAGIGLQVLYLDLTDGPEMNLHNFSRSDQLNPTHGCVRLLYRPGHYDILYKPGDIRPQPIATYLQLSSQPYNDPVFDIPTADFMTMVPGMSLTNRHHGWLSTGGYGGCDFFAPVQQPLSTPVPLPAAALSKRGSYSATSLSLPSNHLPPIQELPIRSATHNIMSTGFQLLPGSGGPFRPSAWELEPEVAQATSQMPLQTSIFKNSHYNTAHFMNPEFQPEEWSPGAEYISTKSAKGKISG